jgi:hypothetical protein
MKPRVPPVIAVLLIVSGCVSTPRETVELSEVVDRQIAAMQVSHEKFVRLYYDKLRDEVDSFLEQKWVPTFLVNVIQGTGESSKQFRADLDRAYRLAAVDWDKGIGIEGIQDNEVKQAVREALKQLTTQEKATLGMVLLDFSTGVQTQINERRRSLIKPIDQQEAYVLDQLRAAYVDLQRGTSALKAHLASVAKLVEERDTVLQKLGVLEKQKKIVTAAVKLNEGAVDALKGAKQAQEGMSVFVASMDRTLKELESLANPGE